MVSKAGAATERGGRLPRPAAAKFRDAAAGVTEPVLVSNLDADLVPGDDDPDEARADLRHRLSIPPPGVNAPGEDLTPPAERAARDGLAPRTRAQILAEMDPQEWACRSQEHSWPQLVPGAARLPRGMRVSPAGSGNVLFTEDCLHDCGRYRETLTERGFIVVWRRYGTRPGRRHTVVHRDESMTKTEMREDVYTSNKKLLAQAVRDATAAAKAAAREQAARAKAAKAAS